MLQIIEANSGTGYFNATDYPAVADIADSFVFDVQYMPLADPSAFELGAYTEQQRKQLQSNLTDATEKAAADATREYRDRLRKALKHAAEKMRGGKGTRLHGSVLTNLQELIDAGLNVSADPELQEIVDNIAPATAAIERAVNSRDSFDKHEAASQAEKIDRKLAGILQSS